MTMLAKNKSGWCLLEYLPIKEEEIGEVIDSVKQTYIAKFEKNMKRW